jgi:transposase
MQTKSFIGLDVHKETISVSVAEDGRNGAVRFLGVIPNLPSEIAKMVKQLSRHGEIDFCYEAGGCGYGIYRQLTELGHKCTVAATSLIPRKPGERIKTDRRDWQKLAILHRSGDLTAVWVPDATHEALRDLVRARVDASMHLMRARQQLLVTVPLSDRKNGPLINQPNPDTSVKPTRFCLNLNLVYRCQAEKHFGGVVDSGEG